MKIPAPRGVALLALLSIATVGCSDGSPTAWNDAPAIEGSDVDGLVAADPLFRSIGPSFSLSTTTLKADGLLMAAADTDGNSSLHAARRTNTLYKDEIKRVEAEDDESTTITLPGSGMRLVIPAGALPSEEMDITVVAYAGKYHVYEFLPHGVQFKKPIQVEFEIANVEAFGEELKGRLSELQKYQEDFATCEVMKAKGAKLTELCQKLYLMWADYNEDADWYQAALSADGFVGVYFKGDVHGGESLPALEVFGITLAGDQLTFYTTHFSGYALGM